MTREDAISVLERVAHTESKWPGTEDTLEALDMAISALRQQEQELNEPMTNADRIRAMSDEEIAEWVCENGAIKTPCDIICGGDCEAFATFDKSSMDVCKEIVMKWLQNPAKEDDHANL